MSTTKDIIKGVTIVVLIFATFMALINGTENDDELLIFLGALTGTTAYLMGQKWLQEEKDEKDGITKSAAEENEYCNE